MKAINLVFVRHPGSSKEYLFSAPPTMEFKAGDTVYCETRKGTTLGVITDENFVTRSSTARFIARHFKATYPLKSIIGYARHKETYELERFNAGKEEKENVINEV